MGAMHYQPWPVPVQHRRQWSNDIPGPRCFPLSFMRVKPLTGRTHQSLAEFGVFVCLRQSLLGFDRADVQAVENLNPTTGSARNTSLNKLDLKRLFGRDLNLNRLDNMRISRYYMWEQTDTAPHIYSLYWPIDDYHDCIGTLIRWLHIDIAVL